MKTVGYHLLSDESVKLIDGAIMHSGFPEFRLDNRKDILQALYQELLDCDLEITEKSDEIFKELEKFPTKTILAAYKKILNNSNLTELLVNEHDSDFFGSNPVEKLRNKELPDIPIIIGSNSFEGKVPLSSRELNFEQCDL